MEERIICLHHREMIRFYRLSNSFLWSVLGARGNCLDIPISPLRILHRSTLSSASFEIFLGRGVWAHCIIDWDNRGNFEYSMRGIARAETASHERSLDPWRQDLGKMELNDAVGIPLKL